MKKLINKANVDGVSVDYPYGNVRDRSAGIQGSEANTEMFGDAMQFFEKGFAESGLTANGLPDNFTNGFQLFDALRISLKGYKSYAANVSQNFTNNPVGTTMVNGDELGTVTFTRTAVGTFDIDFIGTSFLTPNLTFINFSPINNGYVKIEPQLPTKLVMTTQDLGTNLTDGIISSGNFWMEVRQYTV